MKDHAHRGALRFWLGALISALLTALLVCLACPWLIRSIDDLFRMLADKNTLISSMLASPTGRIFGVSRSDWTSFSEVFSSLDSAFITTHFIPALAAALPGALVTGLLTRNLRKTSAPVRILRILFAVIAALLFLLAAFAAALFMTDVNGIRLGRVVLSLIENFGAIASML